MSAHVLDPAASAALLAREPTASAHPKPSDMARVALPWDDGASATLKVQRNEDRATFAAGVAAERTRVAAWLRKRFADVVIGDPGAALADELEGKVSP